MQEIDLTAFLTEPQSPEWEEFRQHYPRCASCSAEVYKWTRLEQLLRSMGKADATAHPSEEALVRFQKNPDSLSPEERQSIQGHLQTCPACREEAALLASFDFSLVQKWVAEAEEPRTSAERASVITRILDTVRSLVLHPAFAYGMALLLCIPLVRSYYSPVLLRSPDLPPPVSTAAKPQVERPSSEAPMPSWERDAVEGPRPAAKQALTETLRSPSRSPSPARQEAQQGETVVSAAPQALPQVKEELRTKEELAVLQKAGKTAPAPAAEPRKSAAFTRGISPTLQHSREAALALLSNKYKVAYEARDVGTLSGVWQMDEVWRDYLTRLFAESRRIALLVDIDEESMRAEEQQVLVPFAQVVTTVDKEGHFSTQGPFFCIADIRLLDSGAWMIEEFQEDPHHRGQCRPKG